MYTRLQGWAERCVDGSADHLISQRIGWHSELLQVKEHVIIQLAIAKWEQQLVAACERLLEAADAHVDQAQGGCEQGLNAGAVAVTGRCTQK